MDERNRADLDYLEFLFREEEYDRVHDILGNPFALEGRLTAGGKPDALIAALERIHAFASGQPSFRLFLELHLISHFLLFQGYFSGRLRSWLVKRIDLSPQFQGMNWGHVLSGSWVPVPVLVVHDEARLVYFIAGILAAEKNRPSSRNGQALLWTSSAGLLLNLPFRQRNPFSRYPKAGISFVIPSRCATSPFSSRALPWVSALPWLSLAFQRANPCPGTWRHPVR